MRFSIPLLRAYTDAKGATPFANLKQTRPKRTTPNVHGSLADQPTPKQSLTDLLNSWEPLSDEDAMPEIEDYPPEPFDL
jgi:hypothetical protein